MLQSMEVSSALAAQGPAAISVAKPQSAPGTRRPPIRLEKAVSILNENYGFDRAALEGYLAAGREYREMNTICLYAYLAKQPLDTVVALRETHTWERLKLALGLTPQKFYDRKIEY